MRIGTKQRNPRTDSPARTSKSPPCKSFLLESVYQRANVPRFCCPLESCRGRAGDCEAPIGSRRGVCLPAVASPRQTGSKRARKGAARPKHSDATSRRLQCRSVINPHLRCPSLLPASQGRNTLSTFVTRKSLKIKHRPHARAQRPGALSFPAPSLQTPASRTGGSSHARFPLLASDLRNAFALPETPNK